MNKLILLSSCIALAACGGGSSSGGGSDIQGLEGDFIVGTWAECNTGGDAEFAYANCDMVDDDFGEVKANGDYYEYEAADDFHIDSASIQAGGGKIANIKKVNDTTYHIYNYNYPSFKAECYNEVFIVEKYNNDFIRIRETAKNCASSGAPSDDYFMDQYWAKRFKGQIVTN